MISLLTKSLKKAGLVLALLLIFLLSAWAFGALWFDGPLTSSGYATGHGMALIYFVMAFVLLVLFLKGSRWAGGVAVVVIGLVFWWWIHVQPSNNRCWQADVTREPWAEVHGDLVTLHNVRNFAYPSDPSENDLGERWETRIVSLSQLTGVDAFLNFWGVSWMAHPILSFQFRDAPPIAFSIETRKEKGENYSALGGLYRQYELVYVVADERDVIRVRTNRRKGEQVYLYHTTLSPAEVRKRFLEYICSMNALREHPRWYNAITANCTTAIRSQRSLEARTAWDWRILLNGQVDEMFYERGLLETEGLPFPVLRQRALINEAAIEADQDPDFSRRIRSGLPGFGR